MDSFLEFEKPIAVLEKQLNDLKELSSQDGVSLDSEIQNLEKKIASLIDETYKNLTTWQRVLLSRHPNRPYTRDYIEALFPDFMELHGDRHFGEDAAIMAGIAHWPNKSTPIAIIGHQKGRTTKQKMTRNFGMAKPEGYRKAIRVMELAERMRIPILTFIDTPGAYPGLETEERGQAQAIAECIRYMFSLTVPVVSVVIGEGGSGGALAIGIANKVLMLEYSTYSVISPEGCASILWNEAREAEKASQVLKMMPKNLKELGCIEDIIPEPRGGAQRNWNEMFAHMEEALKKHLLPYLKSPSSTAAKTTAKKATKKTVKKTTTPNLSPEKIRESRIQKFRKMGLSALDVQKG